MNEKKRLIVLLAGQSNMAGRDVAGQDDLTAISGLEAMTRDFRWVPAVEPVTRDRPFVGTFGPDGQKIESADPWDNLLPVSGGQVRGVGPGRTFGRLLLAANPGCTVGLIPAAVGGSPIAAWKPGGTDEWDETYHPYDHAVAMAKKARGTIVAVLWHQGEADASRGTPEYKEKLRQVIVNFRRDLALTDRVPFLLGELASFYADESIVLHQAEIDGAMRELAAELPGVAVVGTKDLTDRGDRLHFSTESAHRLGERYFEVWRRMTGA